MKLYESGLSLESQTMGEQNVELMFI